MTSALAFPRAPESESALPSVVICTLLQWLQGWGQQHVLCSGIVQDKKNDPQGVVQEIQISPRSAKLIDSLPATTK